MTVISMLPHDTPFLPQKVTDVPKDVLRNFPHSKKVGNYLLGTTLGEGSFAKVKEALHIPTGERVAVKIIDKKKSREDSYVRKNLRREGKILQMIRHGNIVQLLEIMETQNSYYLVTELCRGGDLMDYIAQRRKLTEAEVKRYIRQIVSAMDYLHRLGILHRDLKIENLLLDEYKDIKIIDFGLSNCVKLVQTKDGPRVQDYCVTQCGSPAYAAPELLGRKKYGPQVDIWSIGVNMYAMLTGNLPFTVEPFNIKALHNKMITGQMNPVPDSTSRECRDLIKKLLNPDPDRRISIDDILKHPWICEGPGVPLPRAPCPNKMKTDAIDNSILRHMSEIQGFRIGEVIRYVTGNVPSSATAMYYLISRKLRKHYGNLRASGKIAADNRLQNKTNLAMETIKPRPGTSNKVYSPQLTPTGTRHNVNHTVNSVRNNINTQKNLDKDNDGSADANSSRATDDDKSGYLHNFKKRRILVRKNDADEAFSDILQTRGTNGVVQIPRATSPVKTPKPHATDKDQGQYLPKVANKYIQNNRQGSPANLHLSGNRPNTPSRHNSQEIETEGSAKSEEKRSAIDPSTLEEEPFRRRASTFPGKIERPNVTLNKLMKENDKHSSEQPSDKTSSSPRPRIYKAKTDHHVNPSNKDGGSSPSPIPSSRRVSPYRESNAPPTGKLNPSNHAHVIQFRKHSGIKHRIVNISQKSRTETDTASYDVAHDDDVTLSVTKHVIQRPSRTNRFSRAAIGTANSYNNRDETINEQVSEIPCSTPRPVSSLNVPITNNFRSATPVLPSLNK